MPVDWKNLWYKSLPLIVSGVMQGNGVFVTDVPIGSIVVASGNKFMVTTPSGDVVYTNTNPINS